MPILDEEIDERIETPEEKMHQAYLLAREKELGE